jgi:hypothetical protein
MEVFFSKNFRIRLDLVYEMEHLLAIREVFKLAFQYAPICPNLDWLAPSSFSNCFEIPLPDFAQITQVDLHQILFPSFSSLLRKILPSLHAILSVLESSAAPIILLIYDYAAGFSSLIKKNFLLYNYEISILIFRKDQKIVGKVIKKVINDKSANDKASLEWLNKPIIAFD